MNNVGEVQILNKREHFIRNNRYIFTGVGTFPDKTRIKIKENSIPVMNAPRRVPINFFFFTISMIELI